MVFEIKYCKCIINNNNNNNNKNSKQPNNSSKRTKHQQQQQQQQQLIYNNNNNGNNKNGDSNCRRRSCHSGANNNNTIASNNNKEHVESVAPRKQRMQQKQQHKQRQHASIATATTTATTTTTSLTRYTERKSIVKWKIIISSILSLLCCTSHVLAIRKGRLMSPSSFTALSGDLHVQIQFSSDELGAATNLTVYEAHTNAGNAVANNKQPQRAQPPTKLNTGAMANARNASTAKHFVNNSSTNNQLPPTTNVENIIMSTLVISKYIDDDADDVNASDSNLGSEQLHAGATKTTTPLTTTTTRATTSSTTTTIANTANGNNNREQLLQRKRKEVIQNIPLYPDPRHNVTQIAVPCQTFLRGGIYEMQVITNLKTTATLVQNDTATAPTMTTTTLMPVTDERLRQTLDVRWPSAEMLISSVRFRTYPERPVEVTLRFPEVNCERAWRSEHLPEFWLELVYCGKERTCNQLMPQNITKSSILYAEQVRGFPKHKLVLLKCELFGVAGNYAVQLRPMIPAPNVPITRRFLSVDWSEKYVFNVYARSIFPCDPHTGIGVLYEYPACILEQGDRVRVYAKLRADVASLKPPTSLHYVAEQRVVKSQYSLYFSCDLFTEKYVEYCFVYVSQAISGAVADVRVDCVPTLPVSESDTGGWGPWSEWTACSTNCLGGTRNRYRFCDSPPPRYGAKFCEGPSVETEKCGKSIADTWDCIYETSGSSLPKANRTDVNQEIGPGCRCGCIVHLGASKPKRIIAGATQSCPGRSFWLIQVDGEEHISLSLNFLRLPCATQYIKVRDGPSLSSTLLIELSGGDAGASANNYNLPIQLESTGAQLLVEFVAGDEVQSLSTTTTTTESTAGNTGQPSVANLANAACTGGFLANVLQMAPNATRNTSNFFATTRLLINSRAVVQKPTKLHAGFTLVHLSAVIFASIIILISALLGAQYMVRYRKYHLAVARRRDEGSRLHTPHESMTSLQSPPSRAMSTTTLISEVIYMVKMRPKHQLRHSILRESVDAENLIARETEFNECGVPEVKVMPKCEEEFGSSGSIVTLRNEVTSPESQSIVSPSLSPSTEEQRVTETQSQTLNEHEDGVSTRSGTLTRKDSAKDTESIISSGMSSLCNSPPMATKRLSKYSDRYDAVTLKIRNSRMDDSTQDCDSLRSGSVRDYERYCRLSARSHSASLTNGYYSPAASVVSTATIRTTNPKECKEKQNRKKLLARPGSEFSLGQQEELELDYYDYNVINAGAAPGSYLGMDPAYLIWIPPFDEIVDVPEERDGDKTPEPYASNTPEPDETEPLYEEIKMPKFGHYLSARSNTESSTTNTTNTSPISDELSPLNSTQHSKASTPSEPAHGRHNFMSRLQQQRAETKTSAIPAKQPTPYMSRKKRRQFKQQSKSTHELGSAQNSNASKELIPMRELSQIAKSARNISSKVCAAPVPLTSSTSSDAMTGSYIEKETSVVKSPSDLQNFLAIDDIQFADEEEDGVAEVEARQDTDDGDDSESNVIVSSKSKGKAKGKCEHQAYEKKTLLNAKMQANNATEVPV